MQCPRENGSGVESIVAYTAGLLEASEQIEFERHMAVCEGCRRMAVEQKAVWDALDVWKPAPISPDFNQKLYQRIAEDAKTPWWRRAFHLDWSWALRPALPVAAACAAIVVAFVVEPAAKHHAITPVQQKISIDQVERALDDMDMLKQMSLTTPVEAPATKRI